MRSRTFLAMAVLALALSVGVRFGSAAAPELHLALLKSEPGADSTVAVAPATLRLFWTEAPSIAATTVRLTSASQQVIQVAAAKADEKDAKIVNVPVTGQIAPGVYTVTWRTAGTDGHVLNGTYKFTYRAN